MNRMGRKKKLLWMVPLGILGMVAFVFLGGTVVRLLWNALLPPLFGWSTITFWQALGLLVLCRILFGGIGMHGRGRSRMRERMQERCGNMTPEEREQFRRRMSERWGFGPPATENKG
jgi:hypothetical protein